MYKSLRFNPNPRSVSIVPDFIVVRKRLNETLLRLKDFYRNEVRTVSVNHPLYILLHSLPVNYNGDKAAYVRAVQNATIQIAKTHNYVNSAHQGTVWSNKFIPENSEEIIIVNNTPFDIPTAIQNWRQLEPVKVLRHPFGDIKFPVFNRSVRVEYLLYAHRVNDDSTYVFEINVAMLALQWVCWLEHTASNNDMRNLLNFVAGYPLVTMLESWINIAFFNRYMFFLKNPHKKQYPRISNIHPIQIQDVDAELDRAMVKLTIQATKITRDFARILAELMLPFQKTSLGLLEAADNYQDTRQIIWALNIAYIPIIGGLLLTDALGTKRSNMDIKRSLSVNLSRLRHGDYLRPYVPNALFVRTDRYINQNILPYIRY